MARLWVWSLLAGDTEPLNAFPSTGIGLPAGLWEGEAAVGVLRLCLPVLLMLPPTHHHGLLVRFPGDLSRPQNAILPFKLQTKY